MYPPLPSTRPSPLYPKIRSITVLFSLPPTHGRDAAGTASTMRIHGSDVAMATAPNTRLRTTRWSQDLEPMRMAMPIAGTTRYAASILVLNARPTNPPASTSQRMAWGEPNERCRAHTAESSSRSSHGSGRLSRLTAMFTGDSASTSAAMVAATRPNWRRTTTHSTATAPAPASAEGSSTLQELIPNSRADSPVTHSGIGGLSTLMNPGRSRATKNQLLQLSVIALVAAV